MAKKTFLILLFTVFLLINTVNVFAETKQGDPCFITQTAPAPKGNCLDDPYICKPVPTQPEPQNYLMGNCAKPDIQDIIGKIQPPPPLAKLLAKDPTGAGVISQFLSNAVILIFSLAAIVLVFMIIWAAFDWMTSGGDKEKLAGARSKIINALIGMILFALAFAVIRIFGQFTGFKFFKGQNVVVTRDSQGTITSFVCRAKPDQTFHLTDIPQGQDADSFCYKFGQ